MFNLNCVSVRCAGHNGRATLKEALAAGWKMCHVCSSFICPNCINEFDMKMMGTCPSFIFGIEQHQLSLGPIPVEKVILFFEQNKKEGITARLLEALFFEDEQTSYMPFYTEIEKKNINDDDEKNLELEPTNIQEEVWATFGFVMTKRRRGKFITWEKIG